MKALASFICTAILIANLWFTIQFVLLVSGTVGDWFRYQGDIDWGAPFAFLGKIVLSAVIVNVLGPLFAYLLFRSND